MIVHRPSRLMVARHRNPAIRAAAKRPLLRTHPLKEFKPKIPMHPFDMVRIAVNKEAKNDVTGALKWLGKAVDKDANFLMAYAIRAVIFMKTGQYELAYRDIIAVRILNKGLDLSKQLIADRLAQVRIPPGMYADV